MMPPAYFSSTIRVSENVKAGNLSIRKGDMLIIYMGRMSYDAKEW